MLFFKRNFSEILKIGIPTLIFQLLTSLAITLTNMEATKYGDSVIAGMGAVTRITSLGSLVVFGFIKVSNQLLVIILVQRTTIDYI